MKNGRVGLPAGVGSGTMSGNRFPGAAKSLSSGNKEDLANELTSCLIKIK